MSDTNTLSTQDEMVTLTISALMLVNIKHHTGTLPFDWKKVPEDKLKAVVEYLIDFGLRQSVGDADAGMKGKTNEERKQAVREKYDSFQKGILPSGGGGGGARLDVETRAEIAWLKTISDSGAAAKVNGKTVEDLLKSKMRAEIVNAFPGAENIEKRKEYLEKIQELFPEWRTKHRANNPVLASLIEIERAREKAIHEVSTIGVSSGMFT